MDKLLLISKHGDFIDDYATRFNERGMLVRLTLSLHDALDMVTKDDYSVIMIDSLLIQNKKQIKELRKYTYAPVIIFCKKYNHDNMVFVLQSGADEYYVDECGVEDIYSTVKAVVRRYREYGKFKEESSDIITLGQISINIKSRKAFRNDEKLRLSKREMDIILLLLENKDKMLSYDSIYSSIWGGSFQNKQIKAIRSQIYRLSEKINPPSSSEKYIMNIRDCGYQLNPDLFNNKRNKALNNNDVQALQHILIIGYYGDDYRRLELLLSTWDKKRSHKAESTNDILRALSDYVFSLIIINADNLLSREFVKLVREATLSPILVTANKYDTKTKIAMIDNGADGYVPVNKFDKRIYETANALLRRNSMHDKSSTQIPATSAGDLVLDLSNRKAFVSKQEIELTKKEFDILTLIMNQRGEIVTYEQITDQAWGEKYIYDSYKPVMRLVYKLREKINMIESSPEYIMNVREIGYRLNLKIDL